MPQFVNPYTFIPLGRQTSVLQPGCTEEEVEERFTGVIRCELETKTPLAIPARNVTAIRDAPNPHYYTKFFRVGGVPIIPGSSLRGPIRSVFEQLTGSCMRANGEKLHSLGGKKKPGLLALDDGGRYKLYKARRYRVTNDEHRLDVAGVDWVTGDAVMITVGDDEGANRFAVSDGAVTGIWRVGDPSAPTDAIEGIYLRVNQAGATANAPSVFVRGALIDKPIDESAVECLRGNVEEYVKNSVENGAGPYASNYKFRFDGLHDGKHLPVWYGYDKDGTSYAFQFAWAELSRSVYPVTPLDFIKDAGKLPCTSKDHLCPACSLFGFVGHEGDAGERKASRVRFTDAVPINQPSFSIITLPALLGPRPSAFEFYLKNGRHKHSFSPQTPGTTIAGRKAYWHHQGGVSGVEQHDCDFNSRVECIDAGATFTFDVFFDGVSRKELNALVYTLGIGRSWDNDGEMRCHKIGHGKPVGAGSVLVDVQRVLIRTYCGTRYGLGEADDTWKLSRKEVEGILQNVQAVKKVTQLTAIGAGVPISYPRVNQGGDIFEWFGKNRVRSYETTTLPGYKVLLKAIEAPNQEIERRLPDESPRVAEIPEPETCVVAMGTIVDVRNRTGAWWGEIKPDDGSAHPWFGRDENSHITDAALLIRGQRVKYITRMVPYTDKRGRRVERLRAFEMEFI